MTVGNGKVDKNLKKSVSYTKRSITNLMSNLFGSYAYTKIFNNIK